MTTTMTGYAHSCPLCASKLEPVFSAKDYRRSSDPKIWEVVWCDQCQYGKVANDMTPEEVARFYQVEYYTHHSGDLPVAPKSILDRIRIHLAWRFDYGTDLSPAELIAPGKLCDIGCGNGGNLRKFKEAGFQVVGVEPDDEARKIAGEIATVYAGTGESLPDSLQGGFDYVLLSHVLEHTISPETALANAHKLLKSYGVLVVEVPNNEALGFRMFAELWPWTDVPRHIHYFTEASLRKMLEAAGFHVSHVHHVGYTRQFRNEWIADQKKIWAQIGAPDKAEPNFSLRAWWLLVNTFMSAKSRKYDSLRIHAVRVGG